MAMTALQLPRGLANWTTTATRLGVVFATRVGGAAIAIGMNAAVARLFDLHVSGRFFVFLAFVVVLSTIVRLGFDYAIVRFSSTHTLSFSRRVFGVALLLSAVALALSGLTLEVLPTVAPADVLHKIGLPDDLPWLLIASISHAAAFLSAAVMQGRRRPNTTTLIRTAFIPLVFLAALVVTTLSGRHDPALLRPIYAGSSALVAICSMAWAWRMLVRRAGSEVDDPVVVGRSLGSVFRSAGPLYVVALMELIVGWFTQFYSATHLSSPDVAGLSFALRISLAVSTLLMAINLVFSPQFARLYAAGEMDGFRKLARASTLASMSLSAAMLLSLVALAGPVLKALAPGLDVYVFVFRVVLLGRFVAGAAGPVQEMLVMTGHERDARNAILATTIVCVGLSLALVPTLGVLGAAAAVAGTTVFSSLLLSTLVYRRLGVAPFGFGGRAG